MQFDHLRDKVMDVVRFRSADKLLAEAEKCEIVCANCHAERTFRRQQLVLN